MNANAEKPLIGMALFAFIDAVIVYFANRYALPFSIMWWCAVLSAGCAMWISRFCNRIYNTVRRYARYLLHDAFSSLILYSTARSGCSRSASSILIDCSSACIVSRF